MKMLIKSIIIICLSISTFWGNSIFAQNMSERHNEFIKNGIQYLKNKKYLDAAEEFSKVLRENPNNFHAIYNRGLANLHLGNNAAALADFSDAISLDSTSADSYNNRGLALSFLGNVDGSITEFSMALKYDPDFAEAYINRGSAYLSQSKYEDAKKDFDKALKYEKNNPELYSLRGALFQNMEDYAQAIKEYDMAVKLGLKSYEVYFNRGNSHFRLGNYKKAIADLSIVLEKEPDDIEARNNRAIAYTELNMLDEAKADKEYMEKQAMSNFPDVETLEFFEKKFFDNKVSIKFPHNWVMVDHSEGDNFYTVIAQVDFESEGMSKLVTAVFYFIDNLSEKYNLHNEQEIIENWELQQDATVDQMYKYELFFRTSKFHDGKPAIHRQSVLQVEPEYMKFMMYEYLVVSGDNLFYCFLQSPEGVWEYYKDIYDKSIQSLIINFE